jgi:AhpD family alkylhydroperoxidase
LNVLGLLARHPDLATAFHTLCGHVLFGTTLSPRQRELLILRVAAQRSCRYEFAQHAVLGAEAGLSAEEIARVASEGSDGDWSTLEAALLRAAEDLLATGAIGAQCWTELRRGLDDQQLLDVVFTVGTYDTLAMAMESFGLELDADLPVVEI